MKSVHLELPEDLLARVDEAAGDIPRNRWIRRAIERELGAHGTAVEQALGGGLQRDGSDPSAADRASDSRNARVRVPPRGRMAAGGSVGRAPGSDAAPAERPANRASVPGPNVENIVDSTRAKAGVRPIPKRGK